MATKKHDEQTPKSAKADDLFETNEAQDVGVQETEQPSRQAEDTSIAVEESPVTTSGNTFRRLVHWLKAHKKVVIPAVTLLLLAVLLAVPWTRYGLVGTVWRQNFTVKVLDKETGEPVSSATVYVDGKKALTDSRGRATIKINSGYASVSVEKKYYESSKREVVVPILKQKDVQEISIKATGRQVPIQVVNKISKLPIANVRVAGAGTEVKTGRDGKAVLVLPANRDTVETSFSLDGYVAYKQQLKVTESAAATISLVPDGWVFFLSNASGKIDVVKTRLDGSERATVLEGTGKEDRYGTYLLASRDWKYLALHAKRDADKPKLYLVETGSNKVTTMDEGNAQFTLIGWSGHRFIYQVERSNVDYWAAKKYALKSYDVVANKITTLDETRAEGEQYNYAFETFTSSYILDNEVVYGKRWYEAGWSGGTLLNGKQFTLNSVKPDGKAKKVIKGYDVRNQLGQSGDFQVRAYGPQEVYVLHDLGEDNRTVEEYESGQVKTVPNYSRDDFFNAPYTTYLISPSGEKTFWTDFRDGSNAFFIGDKDGKHGKQIGALREYNAYGWYTEDYLLASKKGSELYVLSADGPIDEGAVLKITDYYKAGYDFSGYGYGYGGL